MKSTILQSTSPMTSQITSISLWKIQNNAYGGDAGNSFNDGHATPGVQPMGPFYEIESSSPNARSSQNQILTHIHRAIHLTRENASLDALCNRIFGVSLAVIQGGLKNWSVKSHDIFKLFEQKRLTATVFQKFGM